MSKKYSPMPHKNKQPATERARRSRLIYQTTRVLAIDPGFGRCGVAILNRENNTDTLVYSSCVVTRSSDSFPARLKTVTDAVTELADRFSPSLIALERLYLSTNQKTAMQVAEVRGALISLAVNRGIPMVEYTPLQVKIAITGYGKSGKREVARMISLLVSLPPKKGRLDDEYDAIAIALTALASYRLK